MSITNYVKFNAASLATGIAAGVAGKAVKDFAEGVRRGITGSTSPINHAKARGRKNTEIIAYPFTVDEDEQQGHYIMFNIYLHGKGKLVTPKTAKQKAIEKQERILFPNHLFVYRLKFLLYYCSLHLISPLLKETEMAWLFRKSKRRLLIRQIHQDQV